MPKITKAGGATNAAISYPVGLLSSPQAEVTADRPRDLDRPRRGAHKHAWVYYAKGIGIDVEGLTKPQIISVVNLVGKS